MTKLLFLVLVVSVMAMACGEEKVSEADHEWGYLGTVMVADRWWWDDDERYTTIYEVRHCSTHGIYQYKDSEWVTAEIVGFDWEGFDGDYLSYFLAEAGYRKMNRLAGDEPNDWDGTLTLNLPDGQIPPRTRGNTSGDSWVDDITLTGGNITPYYDWLDYGSMPDIVIGNETFPGLFGYGNVTIRTPDPPGATPPPDWPYEECDPEYKGNMTFMNRYGKCWRIE